MARSLAARVAAARPARSSSGVANARPAGPAAAVGRGRPATGAIGLGAAQPVTGAARSAPAATPAPAAAAPPPAGAPWDAQAEREFGAGQQAYNDKFAGLEGDWKAREEWYGLGETNNPYSQASLLSHRHEVDERSVLNSAGLQLYSGSTVNRHAAADRSYGVGLESLRAAYAAEQARKTREEEAAAHEWEREAGAIGEGATERASEREPAPAPLPPGAAPAGSGPGASSGKGKKKIAVAAAIAAPPPKKKKK